MGDDGESAGYMQVQEKWHKDRMALLGVDDLQDPEGNFRVGCHFLKECIDKYGLEKGLGYYNSGKAAVTDYSREVLGRMG
jgi:soluble lytic murein transglycosylase-like protein